MRGTQQSLITTLLVTATFFMAVTISKADKSTENIMETLLAGNSSKSLVRTARAIAPAQIPGTSLKTRTPYKISMKKYPSGVLTYTEAVHHTGEYNYVQIDYNAETAKNYMVNGIWFPDAQWEFIPVIYCGKSEWYRLRNRGRPNQYLTWSAGQQVYPNGNTNYYVVLNSNSQGRISSHDFMVKPVRISEGSKPLDYYQLSFKKFPKGVVTWSEKDSKKDAKFIMVDNNKEAQYLDKYKKGGELYNETLFSFQIPLIDDPDTADFNFTD